MNKLTTAWDFVERYYPNFNSSEEIAYNGDLCKLYHEEYEEGDHAHKILIEYYGGEFNTTTRRQIENDYNESNREIYERAIESYIKTLN